ncbi:ATP-binding protein [Anaeroselena agilis]|uniref:4Fe-4S binding protein n=1 Tax=Anaeroselena agilis TaxID=3063788 RepID=A0ABU3NTS1_9FIRM|nr:4Fe-4S binding protein [Selenomonadales bacterium 4137-cl]
MGHLGNGKSDVFRALAARLDRNPVGAPYNETLMHILHIMYTDKEAAVGSQFPPGFTNLDKLAAQTGLPLAELAAILENMAAKGLVVDIPRRGKALYSLSPLVIGFFEYTFMRTGGPLPLGELASLFERYHHERGVAEEFFGGETKIFQTWAYESALPADIATEVLDYEKASAMIRAAGTGALSMCYCRHQARHRGTACGAPVEDVCTSLGGAAEWLIRRGFARPAGVDELLGVLDRTEALGLVHLADNVANKPAFVCHCCGCCCGVLRTINEQGVMAVHPSNFIARIDMARCTACGLCARRCHVRAITVAPPSAAVDPARCLGCGVCAKSCPQGAITLSRRDLARTPPRDKLEQMTRIAKEKGKL